MNDRKFATPQLLPFGTKQAALDTVRYLCENMPGIYIDAVRVLRSPGP